jgi:uncharacterized protein (UPF0264 family)
MVSIQSEDEFSQLRDTGITWVDMKDPSHGALQPTPSAVWNSVGRHPGYQLSVALGELVDAPQWNLEDLPSAISFVKIGLSKVEQTADWESRWLNWCDSLSPHFKPVVVAYADHRHCGAPPPQDLLKLSAKASFGGFLIDTYDKSRGSVFSHADAAEVTSWLTAAREMRLTTVLGGSLRQENVSMALECRPDVIAVRGAVTEGARSAGINKQRVIELLQRIHHQPCLAALSAGSSPSDLH